VRLILLLLVLSCEFGETLKWRHLALILDQSPSKWRVLSFHGFIHISSSYFHLPFPFPHLIYKFYSVNCVCSSFLFSRLCYCLIQSVQLLCVMFLIGSMSYSSLLYVSAPISIVLLLFLCFYYSIVV